MSTHVLDTARGKPAAGVPVTVEARTRDGGYRRVGSSATDAEGRVRSLLDSGELLEAGEYRLTFDTAAYFGALGASAFYPRVVVDFVVRDESHHHVPLLLSPFGFSTYRGS